jgi:hypothetical protein
METAGAHVEPLNPIRLFRKEERPVWAASIFCILFAAAQPARAAEVVLEDATLKASFDTTSGALVRLERKSSGWTIERSPELAVSFRMHVPLADRRDNFILGGKQRAATVEKLPSGNQVRIQWKDLASEHGGVLPIEFTATVTLENGALRFAALVANQSALTIESIEYPYLGDLRPPKPGAALWRRQMWYGDLESSEIYPHFRNDKGYWGVDSPMQTADSNRSLFCLIQSADQGLYVELHDPDPRYLVEYTFEQKPGVLESIQNRVPAPDALGGTPVHLEFRATHFVFAAPKSAIEMAPIVLRTYSGGWQAGVDLYKQWRATWFRQIHVPDWVKGVHSWQQVQVNSPEDDLRIPYRDLVKFGRECAANGVTAIQLVGWNYGGQDRGNPSLEIDPRLGTWQELHDAIAQIQAMGVKVVLFAKFVWADMTTDWYRRELYRFAAKDPFGILYIHGGYSYWTPTQLAGINNRRFAVMCPLSPQYRALAVKEFDKILDLGGAGLLYDEVCHHGPARYCFAADHGHAVPGYIYSSDIPLAKDLQKAASANPDFVFAGEAPEDMLIEHYPVSYFRIGDGSTPVSRYVDPEAPLVVAVTGFDDREMLNRILMYRYAISYEPYNFKGHLSDFPKTLEYGRKIDALRRRYKAWLWDAEYRDQLGATVTADGHAYPLYSVFRNAAGKRAVVVVNQSPAGPIQARVGLPNPGRLMVATPEQPEGKPASDVLTIPARSAAVWLEQ